MGNHQFNFQERFPDSSPACGLLGGGLSVPTLFENRLSPSAVEKQVEKLFKDSNFFFIKSQIWGMPGANDGNRVSGTFYEARIHLSPDFLHSRTKVQRIFFHLYRLC